MLEARLVIVLLLGKPSPDLSSFGLIETLTLCAAIPGFWLLRLFGACETVLILEILFEMGDVCSGFSASSDVFCTYCRRTLCFFYRIWCGLMAVGASAILFIGDVRLRKAGIVVWSTDSTVTSMFSPFTLI